MTGLMRDRELEAALLDVYDNLPGPVFAALSDDTRMILLHLAQDRNPHAGKGRVTNRRLDMRLKVNRTPHCDPPTTHRYDRVGPDLLRCRRCGMERYG